MNIKDYKAQFDIKGSFSSPELYFKRVDRFIEMYDEIDFDVFLPTIGKNLQRGYVWTAQQEEQLILSILMGRYIPPIRYISLITDGKDKIQIIDGKQRLTALYRFINNKSSVSIYGYNYIFAELPIDFQKEILSYGIKGQGWYQNFNNKNEIIPITDEEKIKWFEVINFFGTLQDENHIKNLKSNVLV